VTKTLELCSKGPIWARITEDGIYLVSTRGQFKTPYSMADFAVDEPYDIDRVIWCLLTELGYFAIQGDLRPDQCTIGRYSVSEYVRGLEGVLGELGPYLEAMEADLGIGEIENTLSMMRAVKDPYSDQFAALGLPSSVILWEIIFGPVSQPPAQATEPR
jgi:hypothetical protein